MLFCVAGIGLISCYKENDWSILFCAVTGYTIHQLASSVNDLASGLPLPVEAIYLGTFAGTGTICYTIPSGIIKKKGTIQVDNKKMLTLSSLVLLVDVVLGLVCMIFNMEGVSTNYLMLLHFYNGLSCVFILWVLFSLMKERSGLC